MIRFLIAAALLALVTVAGASPTVAQHRPRGDDPSSSEWVKRVMRDERRREYGSYSRYRQPRGYETPYPRYDGPRVMGWVGYGPDGARRDLVECKAPRSVVGLEKYDIAEARANAISLWMEAEKLHHGVKFMNPKNAIVVQSDCFLSSTGNRGSEKVAEGVGKALQQCVFTAIPCEGPEDEGERRR